jgi:periplasmic protein TonB
VNRDRLISITGAVACHLALLFGLQATLSQPARLPCNSEVEISLVAAPTPQVAPVVKPLPVEIPKPILPPPIIVPKPEPMAKPVAKPVVQTVVPPKPVAPVILPPVKTGDGSSPEIGLEKTTQMADAGVKAEPNYLKNPEPLYPAAARRRHQEGLVLLSVRVTAQGHAEKVEVKQSSGFPLLDEAALTAVHDWEFLPARVGAIPLASEIEVPVRFKLTD